MKFVIFTGGIVEKGEFVSKAIKMADRMIAADSGADTAVRFDVFPDTVVGDMDSISDSVREQLQIKGCCFVTFPPEKDEIDTQLAIQYAVKEGATEIFLLGGVSTDRIDFTLANISLTYYPSLSIKLINGSTMSWVVLGPQTVSIEGEENDLLSLIPQSQVVTNIITKGLYYPLLKEPLYFGIPRGISNVFAEKKISVSFADGLLLFVHTREKELFT